MKNKTNEIKTNLYELEQDINLITEDLNYETDIKERKKLLNQLKLKKRKQEKIIKVLDTN